MYRPSLLSSTAVLCNAPVTAPFNASVKRKKQRNGEREIDRIRGRFSLCLVAPLSSSGVFDFRTLCLSPRELHTSFPPNLILLFSCSLSPSLSLSLSLSLSFSLHPSQSLSLSDRSLAIKGFAQISKQCYDNENESVAAALLSSPLPLSLLFSIYIQCPPKVLEQ